MIQPHQIEHHDNHKRSYKSFQSNDCQVSKSIESSNNEQATYVSIDQTSKKSSGRSWARSKRISRLLISSLTWSRSVAFAVQTRTFVSASDPPSLSTVLLSYVKALTSSEALPCGQPGSDISPHTRNGTQEQVGHNKTLPTPANTSLISPTNPYHVPLSPRTTRVNDSSTRNVISCLLKPQPKLHVGAYNVWTLCQIKRQASLSRALESRAIDVCCVSETRIQDPSCVIHLTSSCQNKEPTLFTLRVSGSPDSASRGLAGVRIALSPRAEPTLLDWIPVDSRLCAVRLSGTLGCFEWHSRGPFRQTDTGSSNRLNSINPTGSHHCIVHNEEDFTYICQEPSKGRLKSGADSLLQRLRKRSFSRDKHKRDNKTQYCRSSSAPRSVYSYQSSGEFEINHTDKYSLTQINKYNNLFVPSLIPQISLSRSVPELHDYSYVSLNHHTPILLFDRVNLVG
ncbi:unnamed protein product [Schistosoma margrebowiei]|uniref:Uncharacterized protein n=1 Tax=Schistosoma margrebowiei TaxID=48269 RepID=A0A183LW46_9TREM|nr:unnamed protein product [Schistosoma margrebowiei]